MLLGTLARPTKQFSPRDETIFPPREDVLKRIIDTKALTTSLLEPRFLESQMAAVARALSRASGTNVDVESLKTVAMFCGVGLFVSLLFATYGLDLSAGFF